MALTAGSCIFIEKNSRHYFYILLTEPEGNPRKALCVGFEHYDTDLSDSTVVLCGDHCHFKTHMAPKYASARVMNVDAFEEQIDAPWAPVSLHSTEPVCTPELLKKLRDGMINSPFAAPRYQAYCEANS